MFNQVRLSSLTAALGAAILAATAVPQLRASEIDKKTTMTFSAPVTVSNETLPAGTYVFKTLDNDRDIVVIMNGDENQLVAILQTIPIEDATASDTTRVEFSEGAKNSPEVMHAWFYPGDSIGWEFLPANSGRKTALVSGQ